MEKGEILVGVVIVKGGEVIVKVYNLKEMLNDIIVYVEILVIRKVLKFFGDWRFNGIEMYVIFEFCLMCVSVIV